MKALKAILPFIIAGALIPLATSCCFPFGWGEPKVWVSEEEDLSLTTEGIESFYVATHNGYITIRAVPGAEEIAVHAMKKAGGSDDLDAAACLKEIRICTKVVGGEQHLGWEWNSEKEKNWGSVVSFEVRLPARISTSASTHNGPVTLEDLSAKAELSSHNGEVQVAGHEGDLHASTHNSRIYVEARSSKINLSTHNGAIRARLSEVTELDGFLTSHNGDIHLTLDGEPSVRIDCGTHNGSIDMEKEIRVTRIERNRFMGTLGDGTSKLRIETHNGSIVID